MADTPFAGPMYPGSYRMDTPAILPPVAFNVPVDPAVWSEPKQSNYPPEAAASRSRRLSLYRDLYDGQWQQILGSAAGNGLWPVAANYFHRVSTFMADLLMASPPTANVDEGLLLTLHDALYQAIVDQYAYGTGLLRSTPMAVESVSPRDWFPAVLDPTTREATADAIVSILPIDERTDQAIIDIDHVESREGTRIVRRIEAGQMGPIESIDTYVVASDRRLVPCPRRPLSGEWGESVFPQMASLVAEIARRVSSASAAFDTHQNPILVAKRDPQYMGGDYNVGDQADGSIQLSLQSVKLQDWRQQPVAVAPQWVTELQFVQWDPQFQGINAHMAEVENHLFAATSIPAALMGILRGPQSNSGVALRRLFAPAAVAISAQQAFLLPRIRKALEGAFVEAGQTPPALDLEWEHPFDVLDEAIAKYEQGAQAEQEQPAERGEV